MSNALSVRASSLPMFFRCPLQWRYRYIDGKVVPPNIPLTVGSAVHTSIERDLRHKLDTGELLDPDAVQDAARDDLRGRWIEEPPSLSAKERRVGEKKVKGEATDQAVALAFLHRVDLAPELAPKRVEESFAWTPESAQVELTGTVDLQEADGAIRDAKTASRAWTQDRVDADLQLTAYAYGAAKVFRDVPSRLVLDALVKTKKPRVDSKVTTRGQAEFDDLERRLRLIRDAADAGLFPPTDPSNWWCCDDWCGYWQTLCPHGRRARVSVAF